MLIIYAHPNKDRNCGEVLRKVKEILEDRKENYEVLDLYEMNYDPILKANEHYTSGHKEVSKQNLEIQEKIKKESRFIFIYPTWWNNMPAILKGFVDRIFTAGYAFKFNKSMPVKLLSGKALVFTTTGGPRLYTRLFVKDRSAKVLANDTLDFCGIKSRYYYIPNSNNFDDKSKIKIEKIVSRAMKGF